MNDACHSPEAGRYRPWILGGSIVTAATIMISSSILKSGELGPAARLAVALAPVVLFAVLIGLVVQMIRHLDELQRRIQLEALAVAFPAACVIALGVAYLQKAGFAVDWRIIDVWPWMFLVYLPAYFMARWRYR